MKGQKDPSSQQLARSNELYFFSRVKVAIIKRKKKAWIEQVIQNFLNVSVFSFADDNKDLIN